MNVAERAAFTRRHCIRSLSPAAGAARTVPAQDGVLRFVLRAGCRRSLDELPARTALHVAVVSAIGAQLAKGPYLLGERFTAADVLWGSALHWITMFKLVPETLLVRADINRILARPAIQRAQAADTALAADQDKTRAAVAPAS
ncbi:glutathione S-transferase C-terminal domain-containing protein [Burkholderia stabilis]|uniref:Glutathione S-transferase n=1 Tax=Burkholderia stabilis TaxID=95485 RepID=A0A1Y1BX22_9BURK|nr:glutathione S-transferase [Burkholderia stabilis]